MALLILFFYGLSVYSAYFIYHDAAARENSATLETLKTSSIYQEEATVPKVIEELDNNHANIVEQRKEESQELKSKQEEIETIVGKQSQKIAYLTFDDGPSDITPRVLDILKHYQIPATFFVIGRQVENHVETTKRIVAEGHALGNHTYSHQYRQIYSSVEAFMQDLQKAENLLDKIVQQRPSIIRAPGGTQGNFSPALVKRLLESGYIIHDWNIDARDTSAPLVSAAYIEKQVLEQAKNKDSIIVLFHDGPGKVTLPQALPAIIEGLIQEGYTFQIIDDTTKPVVLMRY
ncbi:polysaccharide deacetylase family protein [Heliorestis convoluta]|uniref:Polysaccharide deacetylase family protein n=2 Tax=Heliorestis convoluta TaxID=356322 RepID=A0A5Q2MYB3_9FIRM|nr:polysaccharide deacetylase family protein [Heliorestis convoluta]